MPAPSSYHIEMLDLALVSPYTTMWAFSAYSSSISLDGVQLLIDTLGYSYEITNKSELTAAGIIMILCLTIPAGVCLIVLVVLFVMRFVRYWTVIHKQTKVNEQYHQRLLEMQENIYDEKEKMKPQKQGWLIQFQDIEFKEKIAEGSFGIVFRGLVKGSVVAIKKLKRDDCNEEFDHEVQMLASIRHPNILLFMGVCFHGEFQLMITEYMSGRSIDTLMTHSKITYETKLKILRDIARGMIYLHSLEPMVIHRDLKLQNVLVCCVV
jgi:hypothetical protein